MCRSLFLFLSITHKIISSLLKALCIGKRLKNWENTKEHVFCLNRFILSTPNTSLSALTLCWVGGWSQSSRFNISTDKTKSHQTNTHTQAHTEPWSRSMRSPCSLPWVGPWVSFLANFLSSHFDMLITAVLLPKECSQTFCDMNKKQRWANYCKYENLAHSLLACVVEAESLRLDICLYRVQPDAYFYLHAN